MATSAIVAHVARSSELGKLLPSTNSPIKTSVFDKIKSDWKSIAAVITIIACLTLMIVALCYHYHYLAIPPIIGVGIATCYLMYVLKAKENNTSFNFRAIPSFILLAVCVIGVVMSLLWQSHYMTIPFFVGIAASLYTLYLSSEFQDLESLKVLTDKQEKQVGILTKQVDRQGEQIKVRDEQIQRQHVETDRYSAENDKLVETSGHLSADVQRLNGELTELRKIEGRLKAQVDKTEKQMETQRNDHKEQMDAQKKGYEETIGRLSTEIGSLERTRDDLNGVVTQLRTDRAAEAARLDHLLTQIGDTEKAFDRKVGEGLTSFAGLAISLKRIAGEINTAKGDALQATKAITTDCAAVIEKFKILADGDAIKVREQMLANMNESSRLTAENRVLVTKLEMLVPHVESLTRVEQRLGSALENLYQRVDSATKSSDSMSKSAEKVAEMRTTYERTIADLQRNVVELSGAIHQLLKDQQTSQAASNGAAAATSGKDHSHSTANGGAAGAGSKRLTTVSHSGLGAGAAAGSAQNMPPPKDFSLGGSGSPPPPPSDS